MGEVTGAEFSPTAVPAQTARVRVTESFKGLPKGAEMVFQQRSYRCTPRFKTGTRLLLYAYRAGADWEVHACGRGSDFEAEDLLFLRKLPRSAAATRLSGTLTFYENTQAEGFHPIRPLAGLTVQISSPAGARKTRTNADGVYEIYGLPPGDYAVKPELPRGLHVRFPMVTGRPASLSGTDPTVALRAGSNAGVGFAIQEDNRLSGRVLGPDGKALRQVCLDVETLDGQRIPHAFTCTNGDGVYSVEDLPRGQYRLLVNRADQPTGAMPFPTTYYPGVNDRGKATIVSVRPDAPRAGLDFHISQLEQRTVFTGQVQFRDGAPIADASIELFRDGQRIERARSGATGSFEIATLDGGKGELRAFILAGPETLKYCPHWQSYANDFIMNSQTLLISPDTPRSGLFLTVSVSSCPGRLPGR